MWQQLRSVNGEQVNMLLQLQSRLHPTAKQQLSDHPGNLTFEPLDRNIATAVVVTDLSYLFPSCAPVITTSHVCMMRLYWYTPVYYIVMYYRQGSNNLKFKNKASWSCGSVMRYVFWHELTVYLFLLPFLSYNASTCILSLSIVDSYAVLFTLGLFMFPPGLGRAWGSWFWLVLTPSRPYIDRMSRSALGKWLVSVPL